VPEENFWTLWCKGRLTEAHTPTIRPGATPSGLTSARLHHTPIFTGLMPFLPPNQQCQNTESRTLCNSEGILRIDQELTNKLYYYKVIAMVTVAPFLTHSRCSYATRYGLKYFSQLLCVVLQPESCSHDSELQISTQQERVARSNTPVKVK